MLQISANITFQICELWFAPTGYAPFEISFVPLSDKAETTLFQENGIWDVTDTSVSTGLLECGIQYLLVRIEFERRANFLLVNLLLPIGTMGVLNLLVFLLPPDSGERVGYSITLLLAICVFLTIAADNLPKTSYPSISIMCIKLLWDMLISSLVMFFTIIGLRFYHADEDSHVPVCVAALTKILLCKRCCNRLNYKAKREIKNPSNADQNSPYPEGENEDYYLTKAGVEKITWKDVGKASDVFFFFFTLLAFTASHIAYFVYLKHN